MKPENEKITHEPNNNFAGLIRTCPRLSGTAMLICLGIVSISCLNPDSFDPQKPTPITVSRLYCPPDQSPTSTPRIAHRSTPAPSPSPDHLSKLPTRAPRGQSPHIKIQTLQCYPTHPDTGERLDLPSRSATPSPSPSPDSAGGFWRMFR